MKYLFFSIVGILFFSSCRTIRIVESPPTQDIHQLVSDNEVFKNHFTGFKLFDPISGQTIVDINGDKYFTPASNTKVLTFWTALNVLTDSVPIIRYGFVGEDELVFRGTGYPLELNNEVTNDSLLIRFLKDRKERLFYAEDHFQMNRYGSGWAWDDASYYYQRDRSPLPLFANAIYLNHDKDTTVIYPDILAHHVERREGDRYESIYTDGHYNITLDTMQRERFLPYKSSKEQTVKLLSSLTDKRVFASMDGMDSTVFNHELITVLPDSIYIRLLHQSDNFIAEQLLMMCSDQLFDTMDVSRMISFAKDNFFDTSYQSMRWVDGSGLSRYNLISPSIMIYTLDEILKKIGLDRIKKLFPSGGSSGSLKNYYGNLNQKENNTPYVFAKTGTLSNNHSLSGYIITNKNKLLLFSFMHNHYLGSSSKVKREMEKILWQVKEQY